MQHPDSRHHFAPPRGHRQPVVYGIPAAGLLLGSAPALAAAPDLAIFGAYFPAWLICALIGIGAALVAHAAFTLSGITPGLPYAFWACSALGVITGVGSWLLLFG